MRVTFRQDGGLAAFPGLSRPYSVDLESLPPAEVDQLKVLLSTGVSAEPIAKGFDRRTFVIEVHQKGRSVQLIKLPDPPPPEFRSLVQWFQAAVRRGPPVP